MGKWSHFCQISQSCDVECMPALCFYARLMPTVGRQTMLGTAWSPSGTGKWYQIQQKACWNKAAWSIFFEHIGDSRMIFYSISTQSLGLESFDLTLNALELNLLDTSPRLYEPKHTCSCWSSKGLSTLWERLCVRAPELLCLLQRHGNTSLLPSSTLLIGSAS